MRKPARSSLMSTLYCSSSSFLSLQLSDQSLVSCSTCEVNNGQTDIVDQNQSRRIAALFKNIRLEHVCHLQFILENDFRKTPVPLVAQGRTEVTLLLVQSGGKKSISQKLYTE